MSDAALSDTAGPDALAQQLLARLAALSEDAEADPFRNPVELLALDLSRRLDDGSLDLPTLERLVQRLSADGFVDRAERLGRLLGETDPDVNADRLRALFRGLTQKDGEAVPFEAFRERVEREAFGIVITAHPTFGLSTPLMRGLAALATGRSDDGEPLDEAGRTAILTLARESEHRPDPDLSLAREHALSVEAAQHIRAALRRAYVLLFEVARQAYPDRWTELTPRLLTVASWVGYDLDGRADIRWSDTLHKRLVVQKAQLDATLAEARSLREAAAGGGLDETLDLMESRLALSASQVEAEIAAFGAVAPVEAEAREQIAAVSRRMYDNRALRLTEAGGVVALCDRALARTEDDALRARLCVLRAELATHGLALAHTHVRINAKQVHNAIRHEVELSGDPADPRFRDSYLDRVNSLLAGVKPAGINFGTVLGERTSVKQLLMVVAQMLKYGDRTAPVRFLIAECESAFTVLVALYFAKLFGVERSVDISPLFETERALEAGSRVVEQLLENPHYCAYVQARGRLCVQTGFSDAGRYLGQTPAAASIERLRLRLIRVMAKRRLADVQLLIFDTHGESIGRGAHPASLAERLDYVDTPATRGFMADQGVRFKQEISFQGGDGYLYFVNGPAAFATLTRILEHALREGDNSADDPFYDEASYIREFFTTVKEFQVDLMNDPNYGVLLSAFGANLLFPSGSRALKRQHEDPADIDSAHASQLRAIPHNAILQQLGLLANSVGGVGAAIARDPDRFRSLYGRSRRLRQLLGIAEYGAAVSDPRVMKAYVDAIDPGVWIARAAAAGSPAAAEAMLRLADELEAARLHERQGRVFRKLHKDFVALRDNLAAIAGEDGLTDGQRLVPARTRDALQLLHALRLATISEIFLLATRIPQFSSRHDTTPRQLVARVLHLDVPAVVAVLQDIFPVVTEPVTVGAFGEPADYRSDERQGYRVENERIFEPMRRLHLLVQRISAAVTHRIGFFG